MPEIVPVRISDIAKQHIIETLTSNKIPDQYGLRVGLKGGGCGATFLLGLDVPADADQVYTIDGVKVIIDRKHLMYVIGHEIDYEQTASGAGFTIVKAS